MDQSAESNCSDGCNGGTKCKEHGIIISHLMVKRAETLYCFGCCEDHVRILVVERQNPALLVCLYRRLWAAKEMLILNLSQTITGDFPFCNSRPRKSNVQITTNCRFL